MSTSPSSTSTFGFGFRASASSAARSPSRFFAIAAPSCAFHENITTCAVTLSPLPLESAVRTTVDAAAAGSPQFRRTMSTAC